MSQLPDSYDAWRTAGPPDDERCDECGRTPDRCDCADDPDTKYERERDER